MLKPSKTTLVYLALIGVGIGIGYVGPRVPGWLKPAYTSGNFSSYYPDAQTRVILYSTSWCGYCTRTRAYMKARGQPFVEMDIEKSQQARQQHRELGGGGVPVVLIGGRLIRGYVPRSFDAALAAIDKK